MVHKAKEAGIDRVFKMREDDNRELLAIKFKVSEVYNTIRQVQAAQRGKSWKYMGLIASTGTSDDPTRAGHCLR